MDIQYLLFLQNLRVMSGGAFDEILNAISKIALDVAIYLPFVIYWCVDKKWGNMFLKVFSGSAFFNDAIKLQFCIYRPWIRSNLIEPAGDSKVAATGYSFPSGHTQYATATYGLAGIWQWGKRKWLSILCFAFLLLTMFSRNFLGVHTPQDVLVAATETFIIIFLFSKLNNWLEKDEKRKDILTFIAIPIIFIVIFYIINKSYPMDYVDGKLLADPIVLQIDFFASTGYFLGFLVGAFIDRHFIHYEIPQGSKNLPLLVGIGILIAMSLELYLCPAFFVVPFGAHWGSLISKMFVYIFAIAIYPPLITKFAN